MGAIPGGTLKPLVRLGKQPGDCWEWLGPVSSSGYGNKTFNGASVNAKRWLWCQLFGPIPDELVISSRCGNALCMNPHHFVAQDQSSANRAGCGANLSSDDVLEIRRAKPSKDSLPGARTAIAERLAERLGCSRSTVFDIWRRKSWKSIRCRVLAVTPHSAAERSCGLFLRAADEIERLRRIEKAAHNYYSRYVQDEAADVEDCACGREQHQGAVELRDALNASSSAAAKPSAGARG